MPARNLHDLPALERFLEEVYGGRFVVANTNLAVATTLTQVTGHNYERLGLTLINTGAKNIHVAPTQNVSSTTGIVLGANGGFLSLTARDDLVLVGYEWFAVSITAGSTVEVIEVIRFTA